MPTYSSTYTVGQRVVINLGKDGLLKEAYIKRIIITHDDIKYDLYLKTSKQVLTDVSTDFIQPSAIDGFLDFSKESI